MHLVKCSGCNTQQEEKKFVLKDNGQRKKFCRICCKKLSEKAKQYIRTHPKRLYDGNSYLSRAVNLRELGFESYSQYLASDLWKSIRRRVYAMCGDQCYLCPNRATQLHHNRYHKNDLSGKRLKFIKPVCGSCHKAIEFRNQEKVGVKDVKIAFKMRRKKKNERQKLLNLESQRNQNMSDSSESKKPPFPDHAKKPWIDYSPHKNDYRLKMAEHLAAFCHKAGITPRSREFHMQVLTAFHQQAAVDVKRPKAEQLGYARAIDRYKDPKALSQIVTMVRKAWPTTEGEIFVNVPNTFAAEVASAGTSPTIPKPSSNPKPFARLVYEEPFKVVLSVKLSGAYEPEGVRKTLEDCLRTRFSQFEISIPEIRVLNGQHFDLLIMHRGYVSEYCESLKDVLWISETFSKPISEYGRPISVCVQAVAA